METDCEEAHGRQKSESTMNQTAKHESITVAWQPVVILSAADRAAERAHNHRQGDACCQRCEHCQTLLSCFLTEVSEDAGCPWKLIHELYGWGPAGICCKACTDSVSSADVLKCSMSAQDAPAALPWLGHE